LKFAKRASENEPTAKKDVHMHAASSSGKSFRNRHKGVSSMTTLVIVLLLLHAHRGYIAMSVEIRSK
jgi:hypothetical protein